MINRSAGMSDNWIVLIPEDPRFVPSVEGRERARDGFAEIAPEAEEIEVKITDTVEFFDCGTNFERVICPACRSEISMEWWQERMDEDYQDGFKLVANSRPSWQDRTAENYGDGFKLAAYSTPCCRSKCNLHELVYEWPQGFGRFALDAMNPNIGKLKAKARIELEEILGTKLRVIYQHL
jgi:hypothetical protein